MPELRELIPKLVRVDGLVELDGHDGAAGEVDPWIQATRQDQGDRSGHEQDGRQQVKEPPIAYEVEHWSAFIRASRPLPGGVARPHHRSDSARSPCRTDARC